MSRSQTGGRAGRSRQYAAACAVAAATLLLPTTAGAAVLNGTAGPGLRRPADPSTRIEGGLLSYDAAAGTLSASVRLASPTGLVETPAIGVTAYAGAYGSSGRCGRLGATAQGAVAGLPDTFGYPPVPDPNFLYLTQVKLAALGDDMLGSEPVTVSLTGATVVLKATTPIFADKPWNCGWFEVADQGDGAKERDFPTLDETAPFPLLGPGAGLSAEARSLRVRAGRVGVRLRNSGAAARGTVTLRSGRVAVSKPTAFSVAPMRGTRLALPLTRAGRRLLASARGGRVSVRLTISAPPAARRTVTVTVRR